MKSAIPEELKEIISQSVKLLGLAIQDVYGQELFHQIEDLRLKMKAVRDKEADIVEAALEEVYLSYKEFPIDDLHKIAKAFSLMLELINSCEAAYRSFRLRDLKLTPGKTPHSLVFVFTSHPTEARSRNFLLLMDKVEKLLLQSLATDFLEIKDQLFHLLRLSLRLNLANNRRPEVRDEADEIFHIVLEPAILKEQISLKKKGIHVFFRTWVGGDKDGHPFVGPATMLQSLSLSRSKMVDFLHEELEQYRSDIELIDPALVKLINGLVREAKALRKVSPGDGGRIKTFKKNLVSFIEKTKKKKLDSPALNDLLDLIWIYPALVLPLEVREDHELIHEALKNSKQPIFGMLSLLKKISQGFEAKWYVRGLVISMCQSADDMLAAAKLVNKTNGALVIPVIPLFENENGLTHAISILEESFSRFAFVQNHQKRSGGRFEVMLGYSDSSKENGVFPARLLVEEALFRLEGFLKSCHLTPVFFHGSGGSVTRGGGSIKEQIAWWPESALNIFKVTIQGETVQRHFHNPLIMRSQVGKIVEQFTHYKPKKIPTCASMPKFTAEIQHRYKELVKSENFQDLVGKATPYDFLSLLKIGSRPTKRTGKGQFTIRAIPWVLCWTQTRLLLPFWWGLGSSWSKLSAEEKAQLKTYYGVSELMQSYVKNLGFTFAKIELGVWNFHVEHSSLTPQEKQYWRQGITKELKLSFKFFHEISGEENFTWFRPMLGESIIFRSSMIHPLNVIQKISLERGDHILLRETVTGISSGMLTTG